MMRPQFVLLGLLLATGAAPAADAPATPPPAPAPTVIFIHPVPPPAAGETLLPGSIEAWQETPIHARTNGYVKRWHAEIGQRVEAGELLVEIDAPEVDQALAASRAAVAQAEANQNLARINFERWQKLVARKTVPEFELDEREALFKARSADLLAARANQQRYEELSRFKRVLAPFAGTITARMVENGALIDAGAGNKHPLYTLAETRRLRIRVGVPQARLREISAGMPAAVLVAEFPGRRFEGKVARTAAAVEPASRTLLTEVELDNADGRLLPGLYAQVGFKLTGDAAVVLVPTNTVRFDARGAHVATVTEDGKIRMLDVEIGRNLGTQFEIVHGLDPQAAVVLNPTDLLKDGLGVVAKPLPPPPTPPKG